MIHIVGLRSGGVEGVPCPCHSVHCHCQCQEPLLFSAKEKIAKLLCIIIATCFTTRTFLFGGPAAQTVRQLKEGCTTAALTADLGRFQAKRMTLFNSLQDFYYVYMPGVSRNNFWEFGKGMKIPFPKFRNGKGMEKTLTSISPLKNLSHNSGAGNE